MVRKAAAIASLAVLAALPVCAQSRGGARSAGMRSPVSSHSVRSAPIAVRPISSASSRINSQINAFSNGTLAGLLGYPVPGLGFDYTHLAAVSPTNLGVMALIDPATQAQIALALRLRGFNSGFASPLFFSGFGGAPIVMESPVAAGAPDAPPQQQPPIVVVAQAPAPQAAPVQVAEALPLPDPGEFVLVQRDGRLLFAVGFTSEPGRLVYVTKEGIRRSISLDQLDVDTTLRMNEERGSSIQIPRAS